MNPVKVQAARREEWTVLSEPQGLTVPALFRNCSSVCDLREYQRVPVNEVANVARPAWRFGVQVAGSAYPLEVAGHIWR